MVRQLWKKGDGDITYPYEYLLRILFPIIVGVVIYFIIRGIANAYLPK